jgi:hypothetical protein
MKIKEWSQRVLWFVFGAVTVGVLIFTSTSYGNRAEPGAAAMAGQDIQQRLVSLEQRVKYLEEWRREMTKPDRSR